MKTLLKIGIILTLLLNCMFLFSQINLTVYADTKLLTIGDDNGDRIDMVVRSEWYGNDTKYGQLFVYPQYEYFDSSFANLQRYSAGAGFKWNTFLDDLYLTMSIDYGVIKRFGRGFSSFNGCLGLDYEISPRIKISILGTLTERKDIQYMWGELVLRESGYIGIKYNLKQ